MAAAEPIRADFVALWGELAGCWGISPTAARVHALLLSRAEGADAETLCEELGASRGAVSMACRELREWGLVHAERDEGSRRTLWRPETDLEKVVRDVVRARKRREWDPVLEHLHDWIPRLAREKGADARVFRERLRAIEAVVSTADRMAGVFLGGGRVTGLGLKALVGAAGKRERKNRRKSS